MKTFLVKYFFKKIILKINLKSETKIFIEEFSATVFSTNFVD